MRQTKEKVDQSAQTAQDFKKTVHVLLELLGRDMESSNPSRDRDLLIAVRDGLFRVEVSGQLFERIKAFREQSILTVTSNRPKQRHNSLYSHFLGKHIFVNFSADLVWIWII